MKFVSQAKIILILRFPSAFKHNTWNRRLRVSYSEFYFVCRYWFPFRIYELLVNECFRSGLHRLWFDDISAVNHIVEAQTAFGRLFWSTCSLLSVFMFCYQSYFIIAAYYRYEKATVITLASATQQDFPAVTICRFIIKSQTFRTVGYVKTTAIRNKLQISR